MFKFIESPLLNPSPNPTFTNGPIIRPPYQRHSSADQSYSRPDSSLNSSRLDFNKVEKKFLPIDKIQKTQKNRAHSQKKLTLTSAQPFCGIYKNGLGNSQISVVVNGKQAYEGLRKNLQLKTVTISKNAPLEKKGKFAAQKGNQAIRFPTSSSMIRFQSNTLIQQRENEQETQNQFIELQKDPSKAVIEPNHNSNYRGISPQGYYRSSNIHTAPNSPVYDAHVRKTSTEVNPTQSMGGSNQSMLQYCQQKISQLKDHTNKILGENCRKINELQALLLQNKKQIQTKDQIIRQLQLGIVLREATKPSTYSYSQSATSTPGHVRISSTDFHSLGKNNDFFAVRIADLQKKIEVISKISEDQQKQINSKIDKMNNFMERFVSVKFHNMKFTLKTFIAKNEQKVTTIIDAIAKVQQIIKLNQIQSYEQLLEKAKNFAEAIERVSSIKTPQKVHFDDMKTTMNTAIESYKHKAPQSTYQNMYESRSIHESFWNNMEDVPSHQGKNEEHSFTDDSFSYAPESANINVISNNNSQVNEFALGSFPSFSKFSPNICKESLHSIRTSMTQSQSCLKTIEEISKCRQGPVNVYLDKNGSLRYKSSESYIFDRRGNILKPSVSEIELCVAKRWIIFG